MLQDRFGLHWMAQMAWLTIKKATKLIDKDFFLGLGWLLREDKVSTSEVEGELFVKLN